MFGWDSKQGVYKVRMDPQLRALIRQAMEQLQMLLGDPGSPLLHRVFPPAYSDPGDVALQDEYRQLMQDDLVERRRAECQLIIDTVDEPTLSEEQLMAWTRSINSLRLILGTHLGVTEDGFHGESDPQDEAVYDLLTAVLDETVTALSRQT